MRRCESGESARASRALSVVCRRGLRESERVMEPDDIFLIATGNAGKREEFASLLGAFLRPSWRVYDVKGYPEAVPEVEEDRDDFVGNALKKAVEMARATGAVALSDDSGLEVDALGGAPGVYSARWSGPGATDASNNARLVEALRGVESAERTARYVCVVCLAMPATGVGRALLARVGAEHSALEGGDPSAVEGRLVRDGELAVVWAKGSVEGRIVEEARGEGGFGYDPYFLVEAWGETMAEVALEKKNEVSHRARALRKLAGFFGPGA